MRTEENVRDTDTVTDQGVNAGEIENPDRPKGFRFAVVYACILMGDFFVGYVRMQQEVVNL